MIGFSTLGLENRKYFWLSVALRLHFLEFAGWLFAQLCILCSQARTGDLYSAEIQDAPSAKRQSCLSTCPLALSPCVLHLPWPLQISILTPVIGHIPLSPRLLISELRSGSGNCLPTADIWAPSHLLPFSSSITPPRCPQPSS